MKIAQPSKTIEMTEDETYRLAYIRLLLKSLEECKEGTQPQELDFFPEDKKVVEYHALNMTRHAVSVHISIEDCVALFQQRIERLTNSSEEEWVRINEIITANKKLLEPSDKQDFKDIAWYFLRKDTKMEV